jgi:hypothetical protein
MVLELVPVTKKDAKGKQKGKLGYVFFPEMSCIAMTHIPWLQLC